MSTAPSSRPGMGAIPFEGGATFRVWSPFAERIHVAGTFNDFSDSADELQREPGAPSYWSVDVPAAAIGHEYEFVITTQDGQKLHRSDPYAREMTHSAGRSVIAATSFAWQETSFVCDDKRHIVIYEVHIGTFSPDANAPQQRGTFGSLRDKLDDLQDLGIPAIKIMAAGEFPTDVSLGYNPAHIFAIESSYGGPNGFRELVDAANARGIAVILDVVYNHFGPSDLDLWEFDGWKTDDGGGIYFYNQAWRRDTPWGPRPDYGRPEVRRFIRDNAMRWVESRGADGLRWDMTAYIRNWNGRNNDPAGDIADGWSLMQEINAEMAHSAPHAIKIAEDMQDNEWITRPVHEGGAGFDAQWGAAFVHTLRDTVIERDDERRNMHAMRRIVEQKYAGDAFARVVYSESHDEVRNGRARVPHDIGTKAGSGAAGKEAQKRSTLAAAIVFTAPGIPMIFQGQEFLEDHWFEAERPLDWTKHERFAGIRALYRDLIRLRRRSSTTRGLLGQHVNVFHVNDVDKAIAYHRWDHGGAGDDVLVVANFGGRGYARYEIGCPRGGHWRVRFNSDWRGYSDAFDGWETNDAWASDDDRDGLRHTLALSLGPWSAVILSQDSTDGGG